MFSQAFLALAVLALTEARFNQEQVPIPAIAAVTSGGGPGVAATIAGQAISDLLAAANPCAKLKRGDQIIAQLGTGADAVAAAKGMIAAEQNFNPFVVSIPVLCSDPTLPTTPILRGITPKIDPAVGGADVANSLSAKSLTSPFPANGMSVAQVLAAQGFTNFTTKDLAGNAGSASNSGGTQVKVAATSPQPCPPPPTPTTMSTSIRCGSAAGSSPSAQGKAVDPVITTTTTSVSTVPSPSCSGSASTGTSGSAGSSGSIGSSGSSGVQKSTVSGLDFGLCVPTMAFVAGLNGRAATEFTFQAIDPIVNKGQQEALNPNIITNRICDQLTNVCSANAAAKAACLSAKAQILAANTRDASTANTWNSLLGFAGTNINPSGLI